MTQAISYKYGTPEQARELLAELAEKASKRSGYRYSLEDKFETYLISTTEEQTYIKARKILKLENRDIIPAKHVFRPDGICRYCFSHKSWENASEPCRITQKHLTETGLRHRTIQALKKRIRGCQQFTIHGTEIHKIVMESLSTYKVLEALPKNDETETERYIRRMLVTKFIQEYYHSPTTKQIQEAYERHNTLKGYHARIMRGDRHGYRTHFMYFVLPRNDDNAKIRKVGRPRKDEQR